jgi:hypothetical protein
MKRSKRLYLATLAAGLLNAGLMIGTHAFAAGSNPCSEEIATFCKNAAGWPAILGCLEEHESELSDACRSYEAKKRWGGRRWKEEKE